MFVTAIKESTKQKKSNKKWRFKNKNDLEPSQEQAKGYQGHMQDKIAKNQSKSSHSDTDLKKNCQEQHARHHCKVLNKSKQQP